MKNAYAKFDRCFVSKIGLAPRLLLEWITTKPTLGAIVVTGDDFDDRFSISFQYAKPSDYIELEKYINLNS